MKTNNKATFIARAMNDWIDRHIKNVQGDGENTMRTYKMVMRLYVQFLGRDKHVTPDGLSGDCFCRANLEEWMTIMQTTRKCSNATCNHHVAIVRMFLKYLCSKDISYLTYYTDVCQIKKMKCPRKNMEDITTEAIKVLLSMPDTTTRRGLRDYALFSLMYCTATRIDEVLSLTISSINTDGRGNYHLTVHGKGNKVRTIPLLKKENDVVKNYIRVFHGDTPKGGDLLFYVQRNGQKEKLTQSAVSKRLKLYVREAAKICDDVPVTLHCHSLRHARATHWLEQGVGLAIIQKLLGHENINTTMIYVGVSIKQKSKALETLEDEDTRSMPKKWKSLKKGNSLTEFLGLE